MLLVVLWVRSYLWLDQIRIGKCRLASTRGRLVANRLDLLFLHDPVRGKNDPMVAASYSWQSFAHNQIEFFTGRNSALIFGDMMGNSIPVWLVAAVSAAFSAFPWLPRQFSLRTLLLATTLVAVVLGLIVWLVR